MSLDGGYFFQKGLKNNAFSHLRSHFFS